MSVPATGGTQRVNVSSLKRKLVNGKDSGETETVGFSVGWEYVDADYRNFAYVSSGCFYVFVCDRLCNPLYAGTTEKGVCNL